MRSVLAVNIHSDKAAIDALATEFYGAFTNRGGTPENIDALYSVFLPQAIIVKNIDAAAEVLALKEFVEPRREILTNGSLRDFREFEVSEHTEIFGNVAQRFSRYEKSWTASDRMFSGSGAKSLQFVRTSGGWKICALAWDDLPQTH